MQKFVKKPVVIEAIQYDGANITEIESFVGAKLPTVWLSVEDTQLIIPTLEGDMKVSKGDYIIKGIKGEFYPCKPDIFKQSYNMIKENNGILSEGEKRVRKSFNPSALKRVENFKSITASAIDEIAEVERRVKSASKDNPELGDFLRECATAKTALQDASMWGVAALTHQITFDTFEKLTNE